MAFNREEFLEELARLKDVPVLDGEEVQASELIDQENNKNINFEYIGKLINEYR